MHISKQPANRKDTPPSVAGAHQFKDALEFQLKCCRRGELHGCQSGLREIHLPSVSNLSGGHPETEPAAKLNSVSVNSIC